MVDTVIFDLWETLGTKNISVSSVLQDELGIPSTDGYTRKYEEAVQLVPWMTENEMARNFLSEFGVEQHPENIDFVVNVFRQGIENATLFDGMRELLIDLKQRGLKIGLLSNTTVFESAVLDNFGIKDMFDAIVFSWQKGNLKPSHESFNHILDELGTTAEKALFIDDGRKNIESARALCMQAIQFKSVASLKELIDTMIL